MPSERPRKGAQIQASAAGTSLGATPEPPGAAKRQLSSPEERRPSDIIRLCRPSQPARTQHAASAPTSRSASPEPVPQRHTSQQQQQQQQQQGKADEDNALSLARASKLELTDRVYLNLTAIMNTVTGATSRLNKDTINSISGYVLDTQAVVGALGLRLCESEARCAEMERQLLVAKSAVQHSVSPVPAPQPSYSAALRLSRKADPVPIPLVQGPVLAFYPAQDQVEKMKTAEDTKAELKRQVNPQELEVQIAKVRKVANAGVVVQTTSPTAADRLRNAAPPTLRVSEPRKLAPRICLRGVDGNPSSEEIIMALHDQNFRNTDWTAERLRAQCKIFKRNGRSNQVTVIMECSPALREAVLSKERIFIGWQSVEVCDYVQVTCCSKCQIYGHPEKYCKAKETTCGKCGSTGHRKEACTSNDTRCATCHRFGRGQADSHTTASHACPARQYAEQRAVQSTDYGRP